MAISTGSTTTTTSSSEIKYEKPEDRATLSRDDFMKLFVTQLQYQDPSSPMDSAQMSSQMAQFNMVDLMQKNNEAMEKLVANDITRTRLDAVSFIGRDVEYKGNTVKITENGVNPFKLDLSKDATSVKVTIKDSSGKVVRSLDLGALPSGQKRVDWDGKDDMGNTLPAGKYNLAVAATNDNGEQVATDIWTKGTVLGVDMQGKDTIKVVVDDGTEVAISELSAVS